MIFYENNNLIKIFDIESIINNEINGYTKIFNEDGMKVKFLKMLE